MDDGERIAVLEERVRMMDRHIEIMSKQVQQMHDILMQAKGARWLILAAASFAGIAASLGVKFLPFLR